MWFGFGMYDIAYRLYEYRRSNALAVQEKSATLIWKRMEELQWHATLFYYLYTCYCENWE